LINVRLLVINVKVHSGVSKHETIINERNEVDKGARADSCRRVKFVHWVLQLFLISL